MFRNLCARRCQRGLLCRFCAALPPDTDDENLRRISNKFGAYKTGVVSVLSERAARSQTSPARVFKRRTLPFLRGTEGVWREKQRAFGTGARCSAAVAPISFVAYHLCIEVQRINLLMGLLNFCLRRESLFFGYSGAKNEPLARAFFFVYATQFLRYWEP